jgi:nicotinate-nucleotide pyrophosphorylase (carboxylating)
MTFSDSELQACCRLVEAALAEDLGTPPRDLTSLAVIPADLIGQASFVARSGGVLAGLPAAQLVQQAVDAAGVTWEILKEDGSALPAGQVFARVQGRLRSILTLERTALNFLQHLSGVATLTARFVAAVGGRCQVLDTRKTIPGWRLLEKYAVRCGGGHNHRMGLYDGILIKDNHLAGLAIVERGQQIIEAIRRARQFAPGMPIEVEVDSLAQLDIALSAGADIVLLDNMKIPQLAEAVRRRDAVAPRVKLEASGGVRLDTIGAIAETGVDRISVGALTHSAPALDIALDYELP